MCGRHGLHITWRESDYKNNFELLMCHWPADFRWLLVAIISSSIMTHAQLDLVPQPKCLSSYSAHLYFGRSAASGSLRLRLRIPPGAWMSVCCECCVLSGRGLCDELITRPEESYRLWCVVLCDIETSRMRRPWLTSVAAPQGKRKSHGWCRIVREISFEGLKVWK